MTTTRSRGSLICHPWQGSQGEVVVSMDYGADHISVKFLSTKRIDILFVVGMWEHAFVLRRHVGKRHDICLPFIFIVRGLGAGCVCREEGGREGKANAAKCCPNPNQQQHSSRSEGTLAKLCLFYNVYLLLFFFFS